MVCRSSRMYPNLEVYYSCRKTVNSGKQKKVRLGFDKRELTADLINRSFNDIEHRIQKACVEPLRKLIQHVYITNKETLGLKRTEKFYNI